MSIVSIARRHDEKDVNFEISYLKNSLWLKDNGDARVMIHCVIRALQNSAPFSSLRIVVIKNVSESTLKNMSYILLDKEHMEEYEDGDTKYKLLNEKESYIQGNGGDYFVTDVTLGDVNTIGNFTEFSVNLKSPITPERARGFRIEYVSPGYVKKLKNVESYYIGLYDTHFILYLLRSPGNYYTKEDIMEVKYSDLWVILPRNKISMSINPIPTEIVDFKSFSPSSYKEWNIEKHLKERIAYRWRIDKCNSSISGPTIYSEFSSPPLSKWYTYLAIGLAIIGILLAIFVLL